MASKLISAESINKKKLTLIHKNDFLRFSYRVKYLQIYYITNII